MNRYSTPSILRGLLNFFCFAFPVIFAPYFAFNAESASTPTWAAYLISLLLSLANVSLVNIQGALECPFDGDTEDDIDLRDFEPVWLQRDDGVGTLPQTTTRLSTRQELGVS